MRLDGDVLKLDLYGILGVSPSADSAQIRKAYRSRALRSHPDLNREHMRAAEREMVDLNVAAWVLTDPELRRQYDRGRFARQPGRSREWYERVCYGATEWVVPPKPARYRTRTRELAGLLKTLRLWPGRVMLEINEFCDRLSMGQRTALTAACCLTAAWLISYARPTSLVKLFQDEPRTTAASELNAEPR